VEDSFAGKKSKVTMYKISMAKYSAVTGSPKQRKQQNYSLSLSLSLSLNHHLLHVYIMAMAVL